MGRGVRLAVHELTRSRSHTHAHAHAHARTRTCAHTHTVSECVHGSGSGVGCTLCGGVGREGGRGGEEVKERVENEAGGRREEGGKDLVR
jgi:hypothetical protein